MSVTLRDKLADPSPARRALQSLLRDAGGLPLNSKTPISSSEEAEEHRPDPMGLEEVNLLEGLSLGA